MIKLCGIRRAEDVSYINEAAPDYMGMILSRGFRRTVDIITAADITRNLKKGIKKVGVFVDEPLESVKAAAELIGLDVIQLHGGEDGRYITQLKALDIPVWKAVRVRTEEDIKAAEALPCEFLLLDSFVKSAVGGTGVKADWDIIKQTEINKPFFLAGGINADNLAAALTVTPNIDISGGTETDGVKDSEKIMEIMRIYREESKFNG